MGTRGLYGVYYKGKYYIFYCHWDSYLDGLGVKIVEELKQAIAENRLDEWKNKIDLIKIINSDEPPTDEDIEKLKNYTDLTVSRKSTSDWYCLLRLAQGSLEKSLTAGYYTSEYDTPNLKQMIEYSYIVDLDNEKFIMRRFVERNNNLIEQINTYPFTFLPNFNNYDHDCMDDEIEH